MKRQDALRKINQVGENFAKMMPCLPNNYVNGYMQAVRDCKVPFYVDEKIDKVEEPMEYLTTEFAEYICDMVCGNLDDVKNQEDADRICDECKMSKYICDICNEYNQINDFEKSQISVLMKENAKLKEKLTKFQENSEKG